MENVIKKMTEAISAELRQEGEVKAGGNTGRVNNNVKEGVREQLQGYALEDGRVPKFSWGKNVYSEVEPMTFEKFMEESSSEELQRQCDAIQLLDNEYPAHGSDYEEERAKIKKGVAVWTPLCLCDGKRVDENAWFVSKAFLDIDKHEGIRAFLKEKLTEVFCEEQGVWFATVSIGGDGGHIHFHLRKGETPAAGMKRVATALGLEKYDTSVKNVSRCCFMTPKSNWVIQPKEEDFNFENVDKAVEVIENGKKVLNYINNNVPKAKSSVVYQAMAGMVKTDEYQGARWEHIVKCVVDKMGGRPEQGQRHTVYGQLCGYMHNMVKNNAQWLYEILPDWGLPEKERMDMCEYYCGLEDDNKTAVLVRQAVKTAKEITRAEKYNVEVLGLPPLTELDKVILSQLPEKHWQHAMLTLPAIKGCLFHHCNYYNSSKYLRHFGFGVVIIGIPRGGKSFYKKFYKLMITPLAEQKAAAEKENNEYKEQSRRAKNKKEQPEKPGVYYTIIKPDTSLPLLADWLKYANGDVMMCECDELDEFVRTEKTLGTRKIIYRRSYDGENWGQDRVGVDAISAEGPVKINTIEAGTLGAVERYYDIREIEDGLTSRRIFIHLPTPQPWEDETIFEEYTPAQKQKVINTVYDWYGTTGTFYAPWVTEAIRKWRRDKMYEYEGCNPYLIQYIGRAAETAERAGVMRAIETGSALKSAKAKAKGTQKEQEDVEYALWFCEAVFRGQMLFVGDKLDKLAVNGPSNYSYSGRYCPERCFADLPATFTQQDIKDLQDENNWHPKISRFLGYWKEQKGKCKVVDNGDGTYTKVK